MSAKMDNNKVCRLSGPLVYGRVSADVEEDLQNGLDVKGLPLWYRCNSCHRTIRIEAEVDHNNEFHTLEPCHACGKMVDKYHLRQHVKCDCPALKTFCQYCSAEATLGDIEEHYDECILAKMRFDQAPMKGHVLQNISLSGHPIAQDLIGIAEKQIETSTVDKFPVYKLEKYKSPFGYKLFPIQEDGDASISPTNAILQQRQQNQRQRHQQILVNYLNKKLTSPQEKIKRQIQNYALNREAEIKLTQNADPVAAVKSTYDIASLSEASVVKNKTHQGMQVKKYTRSIHDFTASLCRQDARRLADSRQKEVMLRKIIQLNRTLTHKALLDDQNFVIKQAIKLEQNRDTVDKMPKNVWGDFMEDLQSERPTWTDLGLDFGRRNKGNKYHITER